MIEVNVRTAPIGEVISSTITDFVAESLNDEKNVVLKPTFGSFVVADSVENDTAVIAVVNNVITAPQDSVHRPSALGLGREQLKLEQPQIFALLRTEIRTTIIGYIRGGKIFQHLPPQPPDVHDFVYMATADEVLAITEGFDFLRLLITVSNVPSDELLAAAVRQAYEIRGRDYDFAVRAGRALANLFRQDFERLTCMLNKIKP